MGLRHEVPRRPCVPIWLGHQLRTQPIQVGQVRRVESQELEEQSGGLGGVVTAARNRVDDMPLPSYNLLDFGNMPFGFYQMAQK